MDEPQPQLAPPSGPAVSKAIGSIPAGAAAIYIHEPVLEDIIEYSEEERRRETGGFLLGQIHEGPSLKVEVQHFLPARDAQSRAASLRFTHDTWSGLHREIAQRKPGSVLVGWHHTHPDFGVFLSGYDLFIHRNYFRQHWHIALVVDPQRREFGFFHWRNGQVADCGFYCVSDGAHSEVNRHNDEELMI